MDIMDGIKRTLKFLGTVITVILLLAAIAWLASTLPVKAVETTVKSPDSETTAPNTVSKKILKLNKGKKNQHKNGKKKFIKPTTKEVS